MAFTGSNWGRRVKLTGLVPASTQSGFTAVITLDSIPVEAIDAGANSALNGGGDLRFSTDDAGANQLPCEVESFVTSASAGNRQCRIHVRFPTYSAAAREVWMFYKKVGESQPAVTSAFGRDAVWQDYEAVLHMGETGTDGVFVDSTGNGHDTTLTTGSSLSTVTDRHPFGGSWPDSTTNEILTLAGSASAVDGGDFTLSIWAEVDALSHYDGLFGNRFSGMNWAQMQSSRKWMTFGNAGENFVVSSGRPTGTPILIKMRQDASRLDGIENGAVIGTDSSVYGPNIVGAHDFKIGAYLTTTDAGYRYNGRACEARIKKSFDSDDWNALEYSNQSDPASFWTVGAPESAGGGGLSQVGQNLDARWSLLNFVNQNADIRWDVLNVVQQSADLQWGILNTAGQGVDLRYRVLQAVSQSADIRWDVLSALTAVGQSLDVRWNTLVSASQSADVRWRILNAVLQNADLRYDLLAAVAQSVDIRWDVLSSILKVGQSLDVRWSILAAVSQSLDAQWELLGAVGQSFDARWEILKAVANDADFQYAIVQAAGRSVDVRWDVLELVGNSASIQWRVLSDSQFPDITGVVTIDSVTKKITLSSKTPIITIH